MYKLKTNSAAKKRFRRSGGKRGLIKRSKAFRRHLLTSKSSKRKRDLRQYVFVNKSNMRAINALLPY
jgi:large subunit ribosomal protein L35